MVLTRAENKNKCPGIVDLPESQRRTHEQVEQNRRDKALAQIEKKAKAAALMDKVARGEIATEEEHKKQLSGSQKASNQLRIPFKKFSAPETTPSEPPKGLEKGKRKAVDSEEGSNETNGNEMKSAKTSGASKRRKRVNNTILDEEEDQAVQKDSSASQEVGDDADSELTASESEEEAEAMLSGDDDDDDTEGKKKPAKAAKKKRKGVDKRESVRARRDELTSKSRDVDGDSDVNGSRSQCLKRKASSPYRLLCLHHLPLF